MNFVLQVLGMIVNDGLFLLLWFMFFQGFGSVGGWRLPDVALLIGLICVVVALAGIFAGGYRDLARTILSGEIDSLLTQPQPVLPRLLARESIISAWGDLIVGLLLLLLLTDLRATDLPWLLL